MARNQGASRTDHRFPSIWQEVLAVRIQLTKRYQQPTGLHHSSKDNLRNPRSKIPIKAKVTRPKKKKHVEKLRFQKNQRHQRTEKEAKARLHPQSIQRLWSSKKLSY